VREQPGPPDRYAEIPQYSLAQVLAVWAAAAIPMGLLSWVVAPWLADRLGGREPLVQALLICIPLGLIWEFVLTMILIRRELGTLRSWSRIRDALWLRAPRDPRTGRAGGRVWLWVLPFMAIFGLGFVLPGIPAPSPRGLAEFLGTDSGESFFAGAWGWFAVIVVFAAFNTVLGEELLFRGLLLPRMRGVFGRHDWVANGVLFACYHLHTPWVIPTALINVFAISYPSRRYESAWMGILVHSTQSVGLIAIVLALVIS
jgi:membrane protease YdiL (CAAX protease family)